MLTQKRLRELFYYDPETGLFTRLVTTSSNARTGDIAGYINKSIGYRFIRADARSYLAHRLAWLYMYGVWPTEIDHINHARHDNRWGNLREVTRQENTKNQKKRKTNTSGFTGVIWCKVTNKWLAQIVVDGAHKYLGVFADKFEACCARKSAENKYGYHVNHG